AWHETPPTLAGRIIDHPHQMMHRLASSFQPVMVGSVPLHQFSVMAAPRPPLVHLLHLSPFALRDPLGHHPLPNRLLAHLNLMPLGQLLARERRLEIV